MRRAVVYEGMREKPGGCAGGYVPCILELEGLGGTLLEVAVLLIMHRKSRGGLRGDIGLEDCSGLGRGGEEEHTTHPHELYPPRWT